MLIIKKKLVMRVKSIVLGIAVAETRIGMGNRIGGEDFVVLVRYLYIRIVPMIRCLEPL